MFWLGVWLVVGASYQDSLAAAQEADRAGQPEVAIETLTDLVEEYPQDYDARLYLAWLTFQAGDYERSKEHYSAAAALSGDSPVARSGLAWSLLRLGDRRRAHSLFEALSRENPEDAVIHQGLSLSSRPALRVSPRASMALLAFDGHPLKAQGMSVSASAQTVLLDVWEVTPTYRFIRLRERNPGPGRQRVFSASEFTQHEVHVASGLRTRDLAILLHYAFADDMTDSLKAHVVGLRIAHAAVERLGWGSEISWSIYDDEDVGRIAPYLRIGLTRHLFLIPAGSVQRQGGTFYGAGFLSLALSGTQGAVQVGGKRGNEVRPAYLSQPSLYNVPEKITWGTWVTASLSLRANWQLRAAYELHHLKDISTGEGAAMHVATLQLGFSSGG